MGGVKLKAQVGGPQSPHHTLPHPHSGPSTPAFQTLQSICGTPNPSLGMWDLHRGFSHICRDSH